MKKMHLITGLLIIAGIVMLIMATKDVSTYATFAEAKKTMERVKISGTFAKEKDIIYNPTVDPNYFSFVMNDADGHSSNVVMYRPKPDEFERSETLVVTGKMEDDIFVADEVLLKCPSKYKDSETMIRTQK